MSKVKDEFFTDQEPDESFEPDPVYDEMAQNFSPVPEIAGDNLHTLFAALAKAQGELHDAHKDKQGYGYNYADLSQVLSIGRPVLSKHGLSVVQLLGNAGDNVTVTTILCHEKGGTIKTVSSMPVHIGKGMTHAQAVGATSTYLRRYSYSAMVGITQSDTDAAAEPEKPKRTKKPTKDQRIVSALNACEDLETLAEMWKKLTPEQHKLYETDKDKRKAQLQVDAQDKQQEAL